MIASINCPFRSAPGTKLQVKTGRLSKKILVEFLYVSLFIFHNESHQTNKNYTPYNKFGENNTLKFIRGFNRFDSSLIATRLKLRCFPTRVPVT